MFVHVHVQAKNSNRTFSNFNLLRGRCTLVPFPSAFMSLCAPGLKVEQMRLNKRLLSVELVTGSVKLKGEQMNLTKGLVMSAKEVITCNLN